MSASQPVRIASVGGQPHRINERVIDGQWVSYLGEYSDVVRIPPLSFLKPFGGSAKEWSAGFPASLDALAEGLDALCRKHRVDTIYMNLPALLPYLLMARTYAGLNVGFLFLAHSVGSEPWLRQWLFIAPWLSARDTLLSSTGTSLRALLHISPRYRLAERIPLCTSIGGREAFEPLFEGREGCRLLSIGRLEEVKNIHVLLECFARMRKRMPGLRLTVAGEYTGDPGRIQAYRTALEEQVRRERLEEAVDFAGPVDGERKAALFRSADLLINLSTDPGETFGFNLIEAKAWGLPIVCAGWDGFRELVKDGEDGYLLACDWTEDVPAIDKEQTIERCLQILGDDGKRRSLAASSYRSANDYDYRHHFPHILKAVAARSHHSVSPMPEAADIALSTPADLPGIYELERLRGLPFYRDSLLSIVTGAGAAATEPSRWMPLAKPVLHHFAGTQSTSWIKEK